MYLYIGGWEGDRLGTKVNEHHILKMLGLSFP